MESWLIEHENTLRGGIFLSLLLVFALLELVLPRRRPAPVRLRRWSGNLVLILLGTVLVRILIPVGIVEMVSGDIPMGPLGWLELPPLASGLLALLALDYAIYWQHRLFHSVPWLWRLHRLHHTDTDYDVTTGVRFHPFEIVLSTLIKIGIVIAIGAPAFAIVIFEITLSATSLFNHSNLSIPVRLERILRMLIVTPDMHRVHHSVAADEMNRNFGFNFPWWDRAHRTYVAQPARGHLDMTIGLEDFRQRTELRLDRLLTQPFRSG